ncbi:MAG: hypothetical protein ABI912_06470 [Actinomycetota bacterium]
MNRLASSAAIAALTLLVSVPALPASAAPVTLVVPQIDPLPGAKVDFTGDGDDCPADASRKAGTFTVTLSYTTPAGATAQILANGSVAADGTFASSVTLPDTAVSGAAASIISSATCSGVTTASNKVPLSVLYHNGTLTLSAATVAAGATITASGDGCYGGEFVIVYGPAKGDPNTFPDGASGIPAADRSFTTTMTIPVAQATGSYDVYALCPGTVYAAKQMAVTAAAAGASSSAPAAPLASATLGGGFNAASGVSGVSGPAAPAPVAVAPVAVKGEVAFTG